MEALLVVLVGAVMTAQQLGMLPVVVDPPGWAFGEVVRQLPGLGLATVVVAAGGGLSLASLSLMRMRGGGWVLAMALQGIGLADALYEAATGQPPYLLLALGSFVVLVLNQREVRQAFDLRHEHG